MTWRAKSSKSVYKAILQVGPSRDEDTGLRVSDRYFIPQKTPGVRRGLWALLDLMVLLCLTWGLLLLISTGFSLQGMLWVYPVAAAECALMVFLFRNPWCKKHGRLLLLLGFFLLALLLFVLQEDFLAGAARFGDQVILRINQVYDGDLESLLPTGGMEQVGIFFALALIPLIVWFANAVLRRNQVSILSLVLFPLLTTIALFGGAKSPAAMFLLFFGLMLCLAYQHPVRRRRMMGGANESLLQQNLARFESVQKKSAVFVLLGSILLSVLGFGLIRPLLAFSLSPAEKAAFGVQNAVLGRVIQILPEVSGGAYSLQVETVGGGVLEGSLEDSEGYSFQNIEDLNVTLSAKPQERLYLKGYVGSNYDGSSWTAPIETTFDGASMNWNTDGNARLYIQNLPFLRTAYVVQTDELDNVSPIQITVERVNANSAYTYVPYGSYLNDYYEVLAGDGAVAGQTVQQDQYLLYSMEYMDSILADWNSREDTANLLDRVEESYRAFCKSQYLEVAEGLEDLQEEITALKKEKHWNSDEDAEEITAWIRAYLAENYEYELKSTELKEGEDFLHKFLYEEKKGYSIHFASAAVELYRMFGIPARYVVGYECSEALFAAQAGGVFTATLQDDNSQAWAEIYVPGIGWRPEDMTPGVVGTLEEVGADGQRITQFNEDGDSDKKGQEETASEEEQPRETALQKVQRMLPGDWTVEQIIRGFVIFLASLAALLLLIGVSRRVCLYRGYDPFGRRGVERTALGVFYGIYRRLLRLGLPSEVDSESSEFVTFAESQFSRKRNYRKGSFAEIRNRLYACLYGGEKLSRGDVRALRQLSRQLPRIRQKKR